MKRILSLTLISMALAGQVFAISSASPSSTPSDPTPTKASQIEDLKERLATKVAQLRQTQKKAIFGSVTATSVSSMTIETKTSAVKIELTDDIKVFQVIRGKRTTLTTDNISKGDSVVIFGDYDTGLDLLKAKVVFIQNTVTQRVSGTVTGVDKQQFTVTLTSPEGLSYVIDVESITDSYAWDKDKGIIKSGFSKIQIGDTIHVIGTPEAKKDKRISGLRILDIGNMSGTTPTPTPTPEPTASASATTKKVTPKPSPSPTSAQ